MFRAELHVHSTYSDGLDGVEKIVMRAVELGLSCISITDHDTVQGSLAAMDFVRDEHLSITVIPGVEVTTRDGHLLVFFVEDEIDRGMSLVETVEEVRRKGGLCAVSHPFQVERKGVFRPNLFRYVDAVEVFNAKYITGFFNRLARMYAERYGKAMIAGSDAHSSKEVGYGVTYFPENLRKDILGRRTEAGGKRIPISRRVSYLLGKLQ
ncbi:PHP domain-containing protein [Geoglobus ahangari]